MRRDLATIWSIETNNFFLFVALIVGGALQSGIKPLSAYPFLLLLGLLLLVLLSADPLDRLPAERLASWPLTRSQRVMLRLGSLALSPPLWLAALILAATRRWTYVLEFLAAAAGTQAFRALAGRVRSGRPRRIPLPPGSLGALIVLNLRQMLTVFDVYLALIIAAVGTAYRWLSAHPDPAAFPILSILTALAMSTYAQCFFGLDAGPGLVRYRVLALTGWRIVLAKDLAFLAVLFVLTLPLDLAAGTTFGLAAVAVGHYPSVVLKLPQQRWRFAGGELRFGVPQVLLGVGLAMAESRVGLGICAITAGACLVSLYAAGLYWDRAARAP